METNTWEIGKMTNLMEKEFTFLTKETDMKENFQVVLNQDMEDTFTPMEINMKENGLMIKKMEKEFILIS